MALTKRRTAIKSGKVCTADTTVLKQIVWPHELVYDPSGKPAVYNDLPLPLFIQGYLAILQAEKPQKKNIMLKHHNELMVDAAIYGWESVQAFHTVGSSSWRTNMLTGGTKPRNLSSGEL